MPERIENEVVILPSPPSTAGIEGEVVRGSIFEEQLRKQERASPEAQRAEQERQEQERLAALRSQATPVSFARLRGHLRELSLRAAATELEQRFGGRLEVADGRLVVVAPAFASPSAAQGGRDLRELVEALVAGADEIVKSRKDGPVVVAKLPDRVPAAAGGLL